MAKSWWQWFHMEDIVSAYQKVLKAIRHKPVNGHAALNQQNRISLVKADAEFKKIFRSLR